MEKAALQLLINQVFKQTGANGTRAFLAAVQRVTVDDLRRVLATYLRHLADPSASVAVIVTAPTKAKVGGLPGRTRCRLAYKLKPPAGTADVVWARGWAKIIAAGYRRLGYTVTEHDSLEALTPWALA